MPLDSGGKYHAKSALRKEKSNSSCYTQSAVRTLQPIMKTTPQPITFTLSKTISQQLEDFSRVSLVSAEEFLNALLEKALTEEDSLFPDAPSPALRRFIFERHHSIEKAKTIADNYNAFAAEQAQAEGHPVRDEAKVRPKADQDGLFEIWFPVKRTTQEIKKRERRAKRRKSIMEPEEPEDPADWWKAA